MYSPSRLGGIGGHRGAEVPMDAGREQSRYLGGSLENSALWTTLPEDDLRACVCMCGRTSSYICPILASASRLGYDPITSPLQRWERGWAVLPRYKFYLVVLCMYYHGAVLCRFSHRYRATINHGRAWQLQASRHLFARLLAARPNHHSFMGNVRQKHSQQESTEPGAHSQSDD